MPGPEVKNWNVYHALRKEGNSKEKSAKIANSQAKKQAISNVIKKNR